MKSFLTNFFSSTLKSVASLPLPLYLHGELKSNEVKTSEGAIRLEETQLNSAIWNV